MSAHHHHTDRTHNSRRMAYVLAFTAIYMVAEFVGGFVSNSLALLADAGHMLSDVAAITLSLFAIWIGKRPPSKRRTYGYYRVEILAALVNGVVLVCIAVFIFMEAIERLHAPQPVQGATMMIVAVGGLIINLIGLAILHKGHTDNLNVHGAWLHVFTDMLGSVGVIISGIFVWGFEWYLFDPIASMIISLLVVYSAWALIKETVAVLMESVPKHVDPDAVRNALLETEGVETIHDLHIWTITSGMDALSCHVVAKEGAKHHDLLTCVCEMLKKRFRIHHVTIQIEHVEFEEEAKWHCQS